MKIAIAGTGYVGLSNAILLAQHHEVHTVDLIEEKVTMINQGKSPLVDKEIEEYLAGGNLNLVATTDGEAAYRDADYVISSANGSWFEERGECIRHAAFTQNSHTLACRLIRIECKSYHLRETEIRIFPLFLRLVLCKVISIPFLLLTNDIGELIEGN